ncbi:reverse transcriptase-like protein [Alkalicoccobacillus porphyridii]|nr:reverse transcriptase-like protein [Alkalicoccobacillus porphyridii]
MDKLRIEWYYKLPKRSHTYWMKTELLSVHEALLLEEDLIRTGRASSIEFYDEQDKEWTKKEIHSYLKAMETEPHEIEAYIDGGYEIASRRAGLGIVVYYKQSGQSFRYRVNEQFDFISNNNEAEFAALGFLLKVCEEIGIHHQRMIIKTDSKNLYHQASGEWPCYEKELSDWLDRVDASVQKLGLTPQYELISREQNKEADRLATQALESIDIQGIKESTNRS